jgi:hypothetical protein
MVYNLNISVAELIYDELGHEMHLEMLNYRQVSHDPTLQHLISRSIRISFAMVGGNKGRM